MAKKKLNLTVREEFRRLAAELAQKRRRSISALFEDLIEEEEQREKQRPNKTINRAGGRA